VLNPGLIFHGSSKKVKALLKVASEGKVKTIFIFSLCLLLLPDDTLTQESIYGITFERIVTTGSISCMIQDLTGFIWLGDESGLYKYDGYKLSAYQHEPSDPASLPDNWITAICEQDSLTLWIGTYRGGLCRFDKKSSQFTRFLLDPANPSSLLNNRIFSLCLTRGRTLWVGTPAGICYRELTSIDVSPDSGFHYLSLPAIGSDLTLCIYEDSSGMLWFGTMSHGLFALDRKSGGWRNYRHDPDNPASISSDIVSTIVEDRHGRLWIGTGNWFAGPGSGLNRFDRRLETFEHFRHDPRDPNSLSSDRVLTIAETVDSHLWIGTYGGGLDYFDPAANKFFHFKHNPTDPRTINNDLIQSLLLDDSGVLWIGTKGQGFAKYSAFGSKFRLVSHQPGNPNSLSHDMVMSFCEDGQGDLWIGTYGGGLNKWQRSSNSFERFYHDPRDANSLSNDFVLCMVADADDPDILWIGTDGGLNRLNIRTRRFHQFVHDPANPNSISDNGVLCLFQDRQHEFWVGTRVGGLNRLDRKTDRFYHYPSNPADSFSVSDFTILNITEDRRGNLWVSTFSAGLNKLDRSSGKFIHYRHQPGDARSLSFNSVECVLEDDDGKLWIATSGGGLNCFDPLTEAFIAFTEADGLASNILWGIEQGNDGHLWLSTLNGLCRFDPVTRQAKNFTVHDGLQSQMFTPFSHYRNRQGELFFGGVNGFNYFHPDSIHYNLRKPEIAITLMRVHSPSNRPTAEGKLPPETSYPLLATSKKSASVTLSYQQNFFTLEFTALDYHAPLKNQFAYFLEGFDRSWVYCGNRHEANYTRVAPGRYVFRVKGSNNDGLWNEDGASLALIITPPWWRTGWAYGCYVLLAFAAAFGMVGSVVRRQKAKVLQRLHAEQEQRRLEAAEHRAVIAELQARTAEAQKEVEKEQMRRRIAGDLHDEIGSSLSTIALISQMVVSKKSRSAEKSRLKEIPKIARQAAESMRDIIWFINPENDSMDKLVIKMRETANLMLDQANFTFDAPFRRFSCEVDASFRRNLFLIYKEILQNILKHARATHIAIGIDEVGSFLHLRIADNGVGFDTESKYPGTGLRSLQRRAMEMGGTITITSNRGSGTFVTFKAKIP
jgi:signal transduction histidine kinase/ligand-binding sensor domain-containing protein